MYNEHFGLRRAPFRITPDTSLFYTGGGRGDVLDALVYAITSGEGIVKVVGEVGTGKTMLCRMLEERLADNVQIAYLANPSLTPEDILHAIALELGLEVAPGTPRLQVMHRLQQALLELHAGNRRVVALVEEAQSMPVDTLEEIRLLSNLETKNEKLLQIVLFGQPELDDNLSRPEIRQLRERITHSFQLTPLVPGEIKDYVAFRLRASGYRGRDAFTADAYRAMSRASEGLTRRVNIIADKAMLAAFAEDTHDVSVRHVRVAIQDSEFDAGRRRRRAGRPLLAFATVAAGAAILAGAVGWYAGARTGPDSAPQLAAAPPARTEPARDDAVREDGTGAPRVGADPAPATAPPAAAATLAAAVPAMPAPASVVRTPAASPPIPAPAAADPPPAGPAPAAAADPVPVDTPMPSAPPPPIPPAPSTTPSPSAVPPVTEAAEPVLVADASPAPAGPPPAPREMPPPASDPGTPPPREASATTAPGAPAPAAAPSREPEPATAPVPDARRDILEWRLSETRSWLGQVNPRHFSIQLLATDATQRRNLEAFLRRRIRAGQLEQVYVYETRINDRDWFGVLYGEYASFAEARDALHSLPEELMRHQPFIRNISDITALG